ncbi:hypothetical protein [Bradyrhizobium sp. USDA 10063]
MTRFKLFSAVALVSAAIVTPAVAQQAVQEPGAQAFYQSLGVGSHSYPQNALASVGRVDLSVATPPARHARRSARHHVSRQ